MSSELVPVDNNTRWETALVDGNLDKLTAGERLQLVQRLCATTGLALEGQPFQYLRLSGKLVLYARRDATDQLRRIHGVSVLITARETLGDVYIVTAKAVMPDGRTDESTGAVSIGGLKGDAAANSYMKAETKAKRRVTLSICGLGMLDESEVETIPGAERFVEPEQISGPVMPTTAELTRMAGMCAAAGKTTAQMKAEILAKYGAKSSKELTSQQVAEIVADCQAIAALAHNPAGAIQ